MKYNVSTAILVLSLCFASPVSAAYKFKAKQTQVVASTSSSSAIINAESAGNITRVESAESVMPRGRGNGRAAMASFWWGWFSIFPILGLGCAAMAYYKGIPNLGRIRKGRGWAIAGITLATLGAVFSILMLTLV